MKLGEGHVLAVAAALAPPLAVLAPLGLAPLLALAATVLLALRLTRWRGADWRLKPVAMLFGATALLALASAVWSLDAATTLARLPQFAANLGCGYVLMEGAARLAPEERRAIGRALVGGLVLALAVLGFERAFDFPLRRLNPDNPVDPISLFVAYKRGLTVLALLVWPAALVLWRRGWRWAALMVAAVLAALLLFEGGSARLAFFAGLAVAALAAWAPRFAARALAGVLILYVATAPMLHARWINPQAMGLVMPGPGQPDHPFMPRSGYHRLLIWQFVSERIAERPVLGWGLDSSRIMPGHARKLDYAEEALPLHPHNGVLQIWLELGVGGALLLAVLLALIVARIRAVPDRPACTAAMALTAATGIVACLSFGIWQSWWMAAMFIVAALTIAAIRPGDPAPTGG